MNKLLNLKLTPQQCQMMATCFIIVIVIALCYIIVKRFFGKKKNKKPIATELRNRRLRAGTRRYDEARKRNFLKNLVR